MSLLLPPATRRAILLPPDLTRHADAHLLGGLNTLLDRVRRIPSPDDPFLQYRGNWSIEEELVTAGGARRALVIEHEPACAISPSAIVDPAGPRFSPEEMADICKALFNSLRLAHEFAKLVHGAICPGVLLKTAQETTRWVVADYGSAAVLTKVLGHEGIWNLAIGPPESHGSPEGFSALWEVLPKDVTDRDDRAFPYVAPEVHLGIDKRAEAPPATQHDAFSAGMLLTVLATRWHPYFSDLVLLRYVNEVLTMVGQPESFRVRTRLSPAPTDDFGKRLWGDATAKGAASIIDELLAHDPAKRMKIADAWQQIAPLIPRVDVDKPLRDLMKRALAAYDSRDMETASELLSELRRHAKFPTADSGVHDDSRKLEQLIAHYRWGEELRTPQAHVDAGDFGAGQEALADLMRRPGFAAAPPEIHKRVKELQRGIDDGQLMVRLADATRLIENGDLDRGQTALTGTAKHATFPTASELVRQTATGLQRRINNARLLAIVQEGRKQLDEGKLDAAQARLNEATRHANYAEADNAVRAEAQELQQLVDSARNEVETRRLAKIAQEREAKVTGLLDELTQLTSTDAPDSQCLTRVGKIVAEVRALGKPLRSDEEQLTRADDWVKSCRQNLALKESEILMAEAIERLPACLANAIQDKAYEGLAPLLPASAAAWKVGGHTLLQRADGIAGEVTIEVLSVDSDALAPIGTQAAVSYVRPVMRCKNERALAQAVHAALKAAVKARQERALAAWIERARQSIFVEAALDASCNALLPAATLNAKVLLAPPVGKRGSQTPSATCTLQWSGEQAAWNCPDDRKWMSECRAAAIANGGAALDRLRQETEGYAKLPAKWQQAIQVKVSPTEDETQGPFLRQVRCNVSCSIRHATMKAAEEFDLGEWACTRWGEWGGVDFGGVVARASELAKPPPPPAKPAQEKAAPPKKQPVPPPLPPESKPGKTAPPDEPPPIREPAPLSPPEELSTAQTPATKPTTKRGRGWLWIGVGAVVIAGGAIAMMNRGAEINQLRLTVSPEQAKVGESFTVSVAAVDIAGETVRAWKGKIRLALVNSGNQVMEDVVAGERTRNAVNGHANFEFTFQRAARITINAGVVGRRGILSNEVEAVGLGDDPPATMPTTTTTPAKIVKKGVASLAFTKQPRSEYTIPADADSVTIAEITVELRDDDGKVVDDNGSKIELGLTNATNDESVGQTMSVTAISGSATFTDVELKTTGKFRLTASAGEHEVTVELTVTSELYSLVESLKKAGTLPLESPHAFSRTLDRLREPRVRDRPLAKSVLDRFPQKWPGLGNNTRLTADVAIDVHTGYPLSLMHAKGHSMELIAVGPNDSLWAEIKGFSETDNAAGKLLKQYANEEVTTLDDKSGNRRWIIFYMDENEQCVAPGAATPTAKPDADTGVPVVEGAVEFAEAFSKTNEDALAANNDLAFATLRLPTAAEWMLAALVNARRGEKGPRLKNMEGKAWEWCLAPQELNTIVNGPPKDKPLPDSWVVGGCFLHDASLPLPATVGNTVNLSALWSWLNNPSISARREPDLGQGLVSYRRVLVFALSPRI